MAFAIREKRGNRLVYRQIEDLDTLAKEGMRQGFLELMRELRVEARKEILKKNKTGRTYIIRDRAGRRRRHRASAPGQTHANITGKTRKSVSFWVRGHDRAQFGYGVDGKAEATKWGKFLEFGTRKMEARPTLQNAIKAVDAEQVFQRAMTKLLKKMVRTR